MKLTFTIGNQSQTAVLEDNDTARDFASRLPLTLNFEDYASTEKIHYLDKELSKQGAPAGMKPESGDITYYAPWGNLAIFYKDFGYSTGLIKIGHLEGDMSTWTQSRKIEVRIERAK